MVEEVLYIRVLPYKTQLIISHESQRMDGMSHQASAESSIREVLDNTAKGNSENSTF